MISSVFEPAATGRLQTTAAFDFTKASVDARISVARAGYYTPTVTGLTNVAGHTLGMVEIFG